VADNNTNINIKPSVLISGITVVIIAILSWSLGTVYNNIEDRINENREKIKVQWAMIEGNKDAVNELEKELIKNNHTH
jgi:hypothetical protein